MCNESQILIPRVHQAFKSSNIVKGECGRDFTVCLDDHRALRTFGHILIEYDNLDLMEMNTSVQDFSVGRDHVIIINDQQKISLVKRRKNDIEPERQTILISNAAFPNFDLNASRLCKIVTSLEYSILIFEVTSPIFRQ